MLMQTSLRSVDLLCQRYVDQGFSPGLRWRMSHEPDQKEALGSRLTAARKLAGLTLDGVAEKLTAAGYKTGKAAVGAWEKGRNVPDSLVLRKLAKIYGTTADALLWDDALSIEAIRFAAQFDALTDRQQRAFRAMWLAYFEQAKTDEEVDEAWKDRPAGVAPPPSPQAPPSGPQPRYTGGLGPGLAGARGDGAKGKERDKR